MKTVSYFLSIIIFLSLSACRKKTATFQELWYLVQQEDPRSYTIDAAATIPEISCTVYGPGCVEGVRTRVQGMEMLFIHFETEEMARVEARRIHALYKYNWVFDDALGEPPLEAFLIKVLGAQKSL